MWQVLNVANTATADVERLHEKVGRQLKREERNLKRVEEYQGLTTERVKEAKERLEFLSQIDTGMDNQMLDIGKGLFNN